MADVTWELLLEYVKAVLVWPVAAVVIIAILRREIRDLASRIVRVKFPGGELQTRQQAEAGAPMGNAGVNPPPPPLPDGLQISAQQRAAIVQVIQSQAAAARLWEYRYLNHFLALSTQYVLQWFVVIGRRTTAAEYDALWSTPIPDVNQRRVILDVLMSHHLVQADGPSLFALDKGKEYVTWRGALPPPANPLPAPPAAAT